MKEPRKTGPPARLHRQPAHTAPASEPLRWGTVLGFSAALRPRTASAGRSLGGEHRRPAPGTESPLRAQRAGPESRIALPARGARPVPALPCRDAVQRVLLQPAVSAVQPHHHLVPLRPAPPRHHRPQRLQPLAGRGRARPPAAAGRARAGRHAATARAAARPAHRGPRPPRPRCAASASGSPFRAGCLRVGAAASGLPGAGHPGLPLRAKGLRACAEQPRSPLVQLRGAEGRRGVF